MSTFKHSLPALLLLAGMGFASTASASLETRPDGMVYDTDLNITWLADANLAASNTFGIGGITAAGTMSWDTAQSWVAAMDTANYLGYSDWRLPTALNQNGSGPDTAYNVTGSELGHLFYQELGATSYAANPSNYGILTGNPTELAKFSNIQSFAYWSGTEYAPYPYYPYYAWDFNTFDGGQGSDVKYYTIYGWAVRSGDVAAVPLPAAVWLFGSALSGVAMLGVRRRRG